MKIFNSLDEAEDTSSSGFVRGIFEDVSETFSNVEYIHTEGINFIAKAMRGGRWYILKGINAEYSADQGYLRMLEKEYNIMREIHHKNVVQAYDFEYVEGLGMCIVMEYIEGRSLTEWLSSHPTLKQRMSTAQSLLKALHHIHTLGIVHRDIKPDNILISRITDTVKIIDFGLSDTDSYITFKQPAGTFTYASPEQVSSPVPDPRNDIYSIGLVLRSVLPELRFRRTLRRCTLPAKSRPATAEVLMQRLIGDYRSFRLFLICIALISLLALVTGIFYMRSKSGVSVISTPKTSMHEYKSADVALEVKDTTDAHESVAVEKKEIKTDNTSKSEQIQTFSDVNKLGEAGCAKIDAVWKSTAMTYLDTVSDIENAWNDWSVYVMERERDNYLQTLAGKCGQSEYLNVKSILDNRIDENYYTWKQRRYNMQSKL